ncbi:MAG: NAD(P)H-dependent flavin oxidoreductase [Tuberibacillus sp.]
MWTNNHLTKLLGIKYPIIQAGMAGGATTPELVAAVSNAGGLGTLGAGYLTPEAIREAIHRIRQLTNRPFAVNLMVVEHAEGDALQIENMKNVLKGFEDDLGEPLTFNHMNTDPQPFDEQLNVVIEEKVPMFSFTFGIPGRESIERLKANGTIIMGTATTVRESIALEAAGVDVIVAQGSEAGGHRGTFLVTNDKAMVGAMALVPQMVDRVHIPVIASGGIMDGRGIVASLVLGASGVQMGTAFLTCDESGIHSIYKEAILHASDDQTVVTRAFSGKAARGIENKFIRVMQAYESGILPYPIQNALTNPLRNAAKKLNDPEFMSLWAGQAASLSKKVSASILVEDLVQDVEKVLDSFFG